MSRLQALYEATADMEKLLLTEVTGANRQQIIDQLNEMIEKRGKITYELKQPYSPDELTLGRKILSMNENVEKKMKRLFAELKLEMKQIQLQKKSNQSYINPYKHVQTMDGMYMDKKK